VSDNTTLPPGAGGDTIRTLDRTGTGSPKTEVVQLDVGGPEPNSEELLSLGKQLADDSLPVALASDVVSLFARDDQQLDDDGNPMVGISPITDIATDTTAKQIQAAVNGPVLTPLAPNSVAVGVTVVAIVVANPNRKGLVLTNTSTAGQTISLGLNGAQAAVLSGIVLWPGDVWEMDRYSIVLGPINAIASAASGALAVQEFS
jgi:hypothetical protein